jgi:Family of unknown function (DUF5719)
MIRRAVQIGALLCLGVAAWAFQSPTVEAGSEFATEPSPPRFVGCVAEAARGLDGLVEVGSIVRGPVTASPSSQSHVPGVVVEIDEAGGAEVPLSDLQAAGAVGVLVELPSADGAATVVEQGEAGTLIGACTPAGSEVLIAGGGSTLTGDELSLVVTNPYAIDAVVSVTSSSEVGDDSIRQLASLLVPARSTTVNELTPVVPLRQSLSMKLVVERGAVHAGLLQRSGGDAAFTEAVAPLSDWWLPVAPLEGGSQRVVVSTDSLLPVQVRVDTYAGGSLTEGVVESEIPARGQIELPVGTLLESAGGLRVSADSPVVVTLVRSGEGLRQMTPANDTLSTEWIVPGATASGAAAWILNPGEVDAEVVLQPLVPDTPARAAVVASDTMQPVALDLPDAGYLIRSTSEVAVVFESAGDVGSGLGTAHPVSVLSE